MSDNTDIEKLMKAYLHTYEYFTELYREFYGLTHIEAELTPEIVKLFELAWNDSKLGRVLRAELIQKYDEMAREEASE